MSVLWVIDAGLIRSYFPLFAGEAFVGIHVSWARTACRHLLRITSISVLVILCGCHSATFHISGPAIPTIDPGQYSQDDYDGDVNNYKQATASATANPEAAKQARNNIAYGLMTLIDVVYGAYYNQLFTVKNSVAVGSDALTLGLSTASSIATHSATKTILSALGKVFLAFRGPLTRTSSRSRRSPSLVSRCRHVATRFVQPLSLIYPWKLARIRFKQQSGIWSLISMRAHSRAACRNFKKRQELQRLKEPVERARQGFKRRPR